MANSQSPAVDAPVNAAATTAQRYRLMRLSRRFEETMETQFNEGQVPGPLHLSIGQEAVAVGGCCHLRTTDAVLSTHRGHHHCLAKGAQPDRLMAELLGRSAGYSRGRGGSMHVAIPEIGLLGTNGIVGAGLPIATGAALRRAGPAARRRHRLLLRRRRDGHGGFRRGAEHRRALEAAARSSSARTTSSSS